ncbi:N-acetylglucosamine kinase [Pseudonocardia sp. GCM10023141]|uniref:N-acetylglucosamine kinase n=1 Tax=Pseudonocardia sp. GCM10023141 TaxID=3252653 RepID=UPI00362160F2
MRLVAVDGGQSTLRLTVVGSGQVHAGPGFVYRGTDNVPGIVAAVAQAWAGFTAAASGDPVARAVLGLTGLPVLESDRERLGAAIAELLPAEEVLLCADNVTAHAGALGGGPGVALTVGTGVGCLAVRNEVRHRVDGWGHLFGDDGSGFAIGRAGIAAALRAYDGRGPTTALLNSTGRRFGAPGQLAQVLYTSPTVVDDVARFAVEVLDAAAAGDAVAAGIVTAAGGELARTAAAGIEAIPGSDDVAVAATGRLVESGTALREAFHAALAGVPRARPVPAAGSPLDGACLLASTPEPLAYLPLMHRHKHGGFR